MGLSIHLNHCQPGIRHKQGYMTDSDTALNKNTVESVERRCNLKCEQRISLISEDLSKDLTKCNNKLKSTEVQRNNKQTHIEKRSEAEIEKEKKILNKKRERNTFKVTNEVAVNVDNRAKLKGYNIKGELHVPFSFLKKHFEIQGNFIDAKRSKFSWKHTNTNNWKLPENYSPSGFYINAAGRSVAHRQRVRCVDGVYEVPVSTQWDKRGYFYPIQIAQYGLVYHGRFVNDGEVGDKVWFNVSSSIDKWHTSDQSTLKMKFDNVQSKMFMEFDTRDDTSEIGAVLNLRKLDGKRQVIMIEIQAESDFKLIISVLGKDGKTYRINYVPGTTLISYSFPDIVYGIGNDKNWRIITRDLKVDLMKGLAVNQSQNKKKIVNISLQQVLNISVFGIGKIGNISLSSSENSAMFMNAANWLLKFQDQLGGWKVNVTRRMLKGVEAKPGWYSAMGQGQSISLLCRAYAHTKDKIYLDAARKAVRIFDIPVADGGVTSKVMDAYVIYEEYPTLPSLHVLNGFIFSLIGLYDLSQIDSTQKHAKELFDQGIDTLLKILPLYDSGHGSYYDLRHIVLPTEAPNRARPDYHSVHIGQLTFLKKITSSKIISAILKRWTDYTVGIQAPHN